MYILRDECEPETDLVLPPQTFPILFFIDPPANPSLDWSNFTMMFPLSGIDEMFVYKNEVVGYRSAVSNPVAIRHTWRQEI
jgi:hypothetical protein